MKKIFFLSALCAMLCISACTDQKEPTATAEPTVSPTVETTVAPTALPDAKTILAGEQSKIGENWSKVGSYGYDINSDGIEENIRLYTSAATDKNGNIIWDDGQEWVLEVTDGIETFTLFDESVRLGNVYFEIMDYYDENGNEIPNIVLIKSSSASFSVIRYTFNAEKKAFEENIVLNSDSESVGGINQRYTSFPTN